MEAREQIDQELYDIIAEILAKVNKKARERELGKTEQQGSSNTVQEEKQSSVSSEGMSRVSQMNSKQNTLNELLTPKQFTLKDLVTAKKNLNSIREKLQDNPRKYRKQLERIDKTEQKLDNSIRKAERREIILALNTLHNDPKRYVMKLIDSKNKIDALKNKLAENPRRYKTELEIVTSFENRLTKNIDKAQSKLLDKAIFYVSRNPEKYREEISRYSQMEAKLKQGLKKHDKEAEKTVVSEKTLINTKAPVNQNPKEKTQQRSKSKQLELSR